jgi:hypothetical protein
MNSLTHSIATQFVMARLPMISIVMAERPSPARAQNGASALRVAVNAIADAVNAFPILAPRARNR